MNKHLVMMIISTAFFGTVFAGEVDFEYGSSNSVVVQTFDDGTNTFIQLSAPGKPQVRDADSPVKDLEVLKRGEAWMVEGLHKQLAIKAGDATALVKYSGKAPRGTESTGKAVIGQEKPSSPTAPVELTAEDETVLAKARVNLDKLVEDGSLSADSAKVAIDVQRTKLQTRRAQLVAESERLTKEAEVKRLEKERQAKEAHAGSVDNSDCFTLEVADQTMPIAFKRWAKQANYQEPFWEAGEEPIIERHAEFCYPFKDAVQRALTALARRGQQVRLCLHEGNKTPQFIQGNRSCE